LEYGEADGRPYVILPFFGHRLRVWKERVEYPPGVSANPWDAILIYNYLASPGEEPNRGTWISFQSLPNSVSKTKTLERLQQHLAEAFAGRLAVLQERALALGGQPTRAGEDADLTLVFRPLPRVPILLLYWEAEPDEDFPAQARCLFDASVLAYLDLESLLFLVEGLMERLLD
jgi:predicted RNase H-like HicB family nuclease